MFNRFSVSSQTDTAHAIALEPRREASQPLLRQVASEAWLDASRLESGDARALHAADQLDVQMMLHRSMMRAERTSGPAALRQALVRHIDTARVRTVEFCVEAPDRIVNQARALADRCSAPSHETMERCIACMIGAIGIGVFGLIFYGLVFADADTKDAQDPTQDLLGPDGMGVLMTTGPLGIRTASELAAAAFSRAGGNR
jgi:hypothetical protein